MIHLMSNEEKIIKRLRNSAMSYLARYEVSIHQFENTMKRKLSNFQHDLSETESIKFIDLIKNEMISAKFIDDKRFAEIKVRSMRRQGNSQRLIYAKLKEKGLSNDLIQSAIDIVDEGHEDAEMIAALKFIKKKNIGIYYKNEKINDETNEYILREKWFGALSRKGFTLEVIRKVINIKEIENADLILEDNI